MNKKQVVQFSYCFNSIKSYYKLRQAAFERIQIRSSF